MSPGERPYTLAIEEEHVEGLPKLRVYEVEEFGLGECLEEFDSQEGLLEAVADEVARVGALIVATDRFLGIRRCRVCGCTDDDCTTCIERTGVPCSWADALENDAGSICTACVPVHAFGVTVPESVRRGGT